jgi:hypothetical protein
VYASLHLNLMDADSVIDALERGARANLTSRVRVGSCDVIGPIPIDAIEQAERAGDRWLVATGDLHDNPAHMARVVQAAGMSEPDEQPGAHLTLHEVIHGENLVDGLDLSYRALARIANLKALFPEHVHTLLANHELSQIAGAGIVKDGVPVVQLFNDGVRRVFGPRAADVDAAIGTFVRSMPVALRVRGAGAGGGDLLCLHSLPSPELMDRFDPGVLDRALSDEDYAPRRGSASLIVWGRGHRAQDLTKLGAAMNAGTFVLGHEKAPEGFTLLEPNTLILNSDHDRGVTVRIDLSRANAASDLSRACEALS